METLLLGINYWLISGELAYSYSGKSSSDMFFMLPLTKNV